MNDSETITDVFIDFEVDEDITHPDVSDELNLVFLVSRVEWPLPVQFYALQYSPSQSWTECWTVSSPGWCSPGTTR